MASSRNIQLGSCTAVLHHPSLGTVTFGHTIGGVKVTIGQEFHDTKVDQFGETILERFLIGETMRAEFGVAEYNLTNLRAALPHATLAGDDAVTIGSNAGKRTSTKAGLLVLTPIDQEEQDIVGQVGIYKAVQTNSLEIENKNDGERLIPCVFDGFPDENRTDGNFLGFIGDSVG